MDNTVLAPLNNIAVAAKTYFVFTEIVLYVLFYEISNNCHIFWLILS